MITLKNTLILIACASICLTGCTPFFKKTNMSPDQVKHICGNLKQDITYNDQLNRGPSMQGTSPIRSAMLYQQYDYYNCDAALGSPEEDD